MNCSKDGQIKFAAFLKHFGGGNKPQSVAQERTAHSDRNQNIGNDDKSRQKHGKNNHNRKIHQTKRVVNESRNEAVTNRMLQTYNLDRKIGKLVHRCFEPLDELLQEYDWQCNGTVTPIEFVACLNQFYDNFSDVDNMNLVNRWTHPKIADRIVYVDFLNHYRTKYHTSSTTHQNTQRLQSRSTKAFTRARQGMRPEEERAFATFKSCIIPKWTGIRRACLKHDPVGPNRARTGSIPTQQFKNILKRFEIPFTEDTFYRIYSFFGTDKMGAELRYDAFFQQVLN